MVDYKYKYLYYEPHIDKQLKISASDNSVEFLNKDIHWENFELSESLCSEEELIIGSCESSCLKFRISNSFIPLLGKELIVNETLDGNRDAPFQFGKYKVFSDTPTADRSFRDIVAYDKMYDILESDVSCWYNAILPNENSSVTIRQFRESFIRNFGLTEVAPVDGLVNDNITVKKTVESKEISGRDMITCICEANGCFGRIGRDGKFHFVYLSQDIQGIYPANFLYPNHVPEEWNYLAQAKTGSLYPQDPKGQKLGSGIYISCDYEDYIVQTISGVRIKQEENDVGATYGTEENLYVISGNFLLYGKTSDELKNIAKNIYEKISGITYRPFNCEAVGNPCLEVGDPVRLNTQHQLIETYIFQRTFKGIQNARDNYISAGKETRGKNLNSARAEISNLKGKTNTLERTSDETRSELKDLEQSTESKFVQTAEKIEAEVTRATAAEGVLTTNLSITAEGLKSEVSRATAAEGALSSTISQTASEIRSEVQASDNNLSSRITQNANSISSEVTRATGAESSLSSSISQTASQIALKVSKGDVSSQISVESGQVTISGNRLVVDSTNFKLDASGNAKFYGDIESSNITAVSNFYINTAFGREKKVALSATINQGTDTLSVGSGFSNVLFNHNATVFGNLTVQGGMSANGATVITSSNISNYSVGSADYATNASYADYAYGLSGAPAIRVSDIYLDSWSSGSSLLPVGMNSSTGHFGHLTGSARRFKNSIADLADEELDPKRLYDIPVRQYKYNTDYLSDKNDCRYDRIVPGFIAEDIEKYYDVAVDRNDSGEVMDWNYKYIIPPMLSLIQEQNKEIEYLKMQLLIMQGEFAILKKEVEEMKNAQ